MAATRTAATIINRYRLGFDIPVSPHGFGRSEGAFQKILSSYVVDNPPKQGNILTLRDNIAG
jgi:hypothetical protein